jgi:hypothetical protein
MNFSSFLNCLLSIDIFSRAKVAGEDYPPGIFGGECFLIFYKYE